MTEKISRLEQLYISYSTNQSREFIDEIQAIYSDPNSIIFHLKLLSQTENEQVMNIAAPRLKNLISSHYDQLSEEQIIEIQQDFVNLLNSITNPTIQRYIIEDISEFLRKFKQNIEWPQIFEIANIFLQNSQTLLAGIHMWNEIYPNYHQQDSRAILFHVLNICVQILQNSQNQTERNEALNFVQYNFVRVEEYQSEEEKNLCENLITVIQNDIHKNLYQKQDEQELNAYIRIVCNLVAESPQFFADLQNDFLQLALSSCSDESIPIKLRICVHNIIEAFTELIATEQKEQIPLIINNSCELAIEACRNDLDYNFPLSFFHGLSKSFDSEAEELFLIFMGIVDQLSNEEDIYSKKIGLLILRSISEGFQELIADNIGQYLEYAINSDADDEEVVNSVCNVIREITDNTPESLIPFVDNIVEYLLQRMQFHDALIVLDNFLFKVEKVPSDISSLFESLMDGIENQDDFTIEKILSCVTSALQHFDDVDESIFAQMQPLFDYLIHDRENVKYSVFECIGRLTKCCPLSVEQQIGNIVNEIEGCFSEKDAQIESLCLCIEEICRILPESFAEFIQVIVPPLCCNLQDEERSITDAACCLRTLAKMFGLMPFKMQDYEELIIENLKKKPFENNRFIIPCCEGIGYAIDGLVDLSHDTSFFVSTFLPCIRQNDSKDSIFGLLMICGQAFSSLTNLTQEFFGEYFAIYLDALSLKFPGLLKSDVSQEIDPSLILPLFYSLTQFLHVSGPELVSTVIEPLFSVLQTHITSSSSIMRVYCANCLARVCKICGITNELFDFVSNSVFSLTADKNEVVIRVTLMSLVYLITTCKEKVSDVIEYVRSCYELSSPTVIRRAAILESKVAMQSQSKELIEETMGMIENPVFDSDEIVHEAEFAEFLLKNGVKIENVLQILVEFFASTNFYVHQVSSDTYNFLLQAIKSCTLEVITEVAKFNQNKIARITRRISE